MATGDVEIANMSIRNQERKQVAAVLMLIAVIGSSLVPLAIAIGGGGEVPFLLSASIRLGLFIGSLTFLIIAYRTLFFDRGIWALVSQRLLSLPIILFIVAHFDFAFFALSTRFIDISITTILFESWPIFLILTVWWLFRNEKRYRSITPWTILLLCLGFVGFAFVILSEAGGIYQLRNTHSIWNLIWGILLAIISVGITTLAAFGLRWGADLGKTLAAELETGKDKVSLELFSVVVANLIGNSSAILISAFGGMFILEESITGHSFLIAIVVGAFAVTASSVAWRKANLITDDLGINALSYLMPILSLALLWFFSQINVTRPDYLVIGAAAIIVANLLINFEAEVRLGFKSLIIALWVCGVLVYLRPVDGSFLIIDDWIWTGTSYFQALALAATVFTLILSFRVARLVSRTTEEENRTFTLFQNLDLLVHRNVLSPDVRNHILTIDVSEQKPRELKRAYDRIMTCITEASANDATDEDRRLLSEATAELNSLVHSKQHGLVIGELFALYIFAGISVFISLFARPDVTGWTAFLVETFAMLFSAVVIFLISNVHDLQKARIAGILTQTKRGDYGVVFRNVQARAFEQWLSVVIIVVLGVGYGWLLWAKWIQ